MKPLCFWMVAVLMVLLLGVQGVNAQSTFQIPLTLSDGLNSSTLRLGFSPTANYCIDSTDHVGIYSEYEAPPFPPAGVYYAVFTEPHGVPSECFPFSYFDFRPFVGANQVDTFRVAFQVGDISPAGYPVTVSWPAGLGTYFSAIQLIDDFDGTLIDVDMLSATSTMITDEAYTAFRVVTTLIGAPPVPVKYLTITPDTIIAKDPIKGKFLKSVKRVKLGKPINPPNWANLLDETVAQGGFAPGAPESDDAGGMVIGVSYMQEVALDKWKVQKIIGDTAWVRVGKWNFKKSIGAGYSELQKTLEDKVGTHDLYIRGLDSTLNPGDLKRKFLKGQFKGIFPKKSKNKLFAELVALKFNIAASYMEKTPAGLGELVYDNDGNSFDEMSVAGISEQANQMMTYWKQYTPEQFQDLYDAVYAINRAFVGPIDTVSFGTVGGTLVLNGAVDVNDVPFLKLGTTPPLRIEPRTTQTESEEYVDFDDEEWDSMDVPAVAKLYNNYPNPFNPTTTIAFRLREESMVTLKVYNTLGQEVVTLLNREEMEAGVQTAQFVANRLASGIYFYRLQVEGLEAGERTFETGKMMLVK
jgi:hypothetical protein